MKQKILALFIFSFVRIEPIATMEKENSSEYSLDGTFDTVPDEIIMHIISFLQSTLRDQKEIAQDLMQLKRVNKKFDNLMSDDLLQENFLGLIEKYFIENPGVLRMVRLALENPISFFQNTPIPDLWKERRKRIGIEDFVLELLAESQFKKQLGCIALMRACSSINHENVQSMLNSGAHANNWNNKALLKLSLDPIENDKMLTFRIGDNFFQISGNMLKALYFMAIVGLFLKVLPVYS
jgi:hypothetical protein